MVTYTLSTFNFTGAMDAVLGSEPTPLMVLDGGQGPDGGFPPGYPYGGGSSNLLDLVPHQIFNFNIKALAESCAKSLDGLRLSLQQLPKPGSLTQFVVGMFSIKDDKAAAAASSNSELPGLAQAFEVGVDINANVLQRLFQAAKGRHVVVLQRHAARHKIKEGEHAHVAGLTHHGHQTAALQVQTLADALAQANRQVVRLASSTAPRCIDSLAAMGQALQLGVEAMEVLNAIHTFTTPGGDAHFVSLIHKTHFNDNAFNMIRAYVLNNDPRFKEMPDLLPVGDAMRQLLQALLNPSEEQMSALQADGAGVTMANTHDVLIAMLTTYLMHIHQKHNGNSNWLDDDATFSSHIWLPEYLQFSALWKTEEGDLCFTYKGKVVTLSKEILVAEGLDI